MTDRTDWLCMLKVVAYLRTALDDLNHNMLVGHIKPRDVAEARKLQRNLAFVLDMARKQLEGMQ